MTVQLQMKNDKLLGTLLDSLARAELKKRVQGYDDAAKNPFKHLKTSDKKNVGMYFLQ